jgi:hypothetical protein
LAWSNSCRRTGAATGGEAVKRIKSNNYVHRPRDVFAKPNSARSPRADDTPEVLQPREVLKRTPASVWDLGKTK